MLQALCLQFFFYVFLFEVQLFKQARTVFHSLLICQFYQLPAAAVMTVHQRLHQIMVFFRQLAVTADGSLLLRFAQLTVIPILQEYFLKPS